MTGCSLCGANARITRLTPTLFDADCARCGTYLITRQAADELLAFPEVGMALTDIVSRVTGR